MAKTERVNLQDGAEALGVSLSGLQCEQLNTYAAFIRKWNATINLVSRKDIGRLENRHFLDCLAALPYLQGSRCLDIGSGAGLPGLVLAIAQPQVHYTLCERMARRCRFLQTVVREMGLDNVDVMQVDADALANQAFDTVTARAVAKPEVIWSWAEPLLTESGSVLIFSSTSDTTEEEDVDYDFPARVTYHRYQLPGIDQAHTLMQMARKLEIANDKARPVTNEP